jgi:acetyltransferase-like isoleucine patch superfamily enzyme
MPKNRYRTGRYFSARNSKIAKQSFFGNDCVVKRSEITSFFGCGDFVRIYDATVGAFCSVGDNVLVGAGHHDVCRVTTSLFKYARTDWWFDADYRAGVKPLSVTDDGESFAWRRRTVIGADVWIGANSVIASGVTVGLGAVIGANSFVNRDVEPYEIVAGTPIRRLRYRFDRKLRGQLAKSRWWELPISTLLKLDIRDPIAFLHCLKTLRKEDELCQRRRYRRA